MIFPENKLIIIAGPTGVGKSAAAIELAQIIGGEIISADSMQIYKHMDIGTAKVTPKEMGSINHYLIDQLTPDEEFNIYVFKEMAEAAILKIRANGHVPIICGGTGFYIQALLYDIEFEEEIDDGYRKYLEELLDSEGNTYLHDMLREVDPVSASKIHANDSKRVIRALVFSHNNNRPISEHNIEQEIKTSPYDFTYFVLTDDRQIIYDNIDKRVDKMIESGLVEEVSALCKRGYGRELVSMQGLGYKEIISYLNNEITLDEAIRIIKRDTRHFAKRQLTWYKRESNTIFINKRITGSSCAQTVNAMLNELR